MKRNFGIHFAALFVFLTAGCVGSTERILIVDHGRSACTGEGLFVCLRVANEDSGEFLNFYDNIVGLEPVLGHRYRVRVREERIDNPPQDSSNVIYHLQQVLSDELVPPDSTFDFQLTPAQYTPGFAHLAIDTDTSGHLIDATPFTGTAEQIAAIRAGLLGQAPFTVVFGYDAQYRLVVNQVR